MYTIILDTFTDLFGDAVSRIKYPPPPAAPPPPPVILPPFPIPALWYM